MAEELFQFRVPRAAFESFRSLADPDDELVRLLAAAAAESGTRITIHLSREQSLRIRDQLTLYLAKFGFDDDYALTKEGRVLEDLNDLLLVP
jgi:hypothetical protein